MESHENDFNALLREVVRQARALGIPVSPGLSPNVIVNHRATTRFGCCIKCGNAYTVELSHRLLTAGEQACRQTLAHEVLHACPGCRNHGARWKDYANRMNAAYGYRIARTDTCTALGIPDQRPVRHLVVCQQCGMEFPRAKASRLVQHPERYRCKCGGLLKLQF